MAVPPALWVFLLLIKRHDHEFLQLTLRPFRFFTWFFWIVGAIAATASLAEKRGPLVILCFYLGTVGAGFGFISSWITKECGLEEPAPKEWWPAKRD